MPSLTLWSPPGHLPSLTIAKRKHGSSFNLTDSDVGVGQENMESIHEILGNQVRPSNHVEWVTKHWHVNVLTDTVEVLKDVLVNFHEDDLLRHVAVIEFTTSWNFFLRSSSKNQDALLLDLIRAWCFGEELDIVSSLWDGKAEHKELVIAN